MSDFLLNVLHGHFVSAVGFLVDKGTMQDRLRWAFLSGLSPIVSTPGCNAIAIRQAIPSAASADFKAIESILANTNDGDIKIIDMDEDKAAEVARKILNVFNVISKSLPKGS